MHSDLIPTDFARRRPAAGLAALLASLAAAGLLLSGCDDSDSAAPAPTPAPVPEPEPEPEPEPASATYTFAQPEIFISPRIPGSLPDGVDFAPPLAMVAHAPGEAPWAPGETASDGLKLLAETGDSSALLAEAEAAGATVVFASLAQMLALFFTPDPSIEVELERPCFSYAQMIAPSSDWFGGFSDVCATGADGRWMDEVSAEMLMYDAGTATGEEFEFKTADTEPREPVALLEAPPYFTSPALAQIIEATRKAE